jgi:hypothetical protein
MNKSKSASPVHNLWKPVSRQAINICFNYGLAIVKYCSTAVEKDPVGTFRAED